jgi:TrmH family RNA methyltransferase
VASSSDDVIRSHDNRTVELIRSLRLRKVRDMERAFVVEGVRAVEDGLRAGGTAQVVLVREGADWAPPAGGTVVVVRRVDPVLFDSLADTVTPQPVLAVFDYPGNALPTTVLPLILIVDGLRDPGNLGTLLRSAAASGVTAVFLTPGTVDPYNGKAVRAGMGAQFRIAIRDWVDESESWTRSVCRRFVLAEADGDRVYSDIDWRGPIGLIVGSEADGPSELGRSLATDHARIPLLAGVESLNAGVAGAVILFEAARQRRDRPFQ